MDALYLILLIPILWAFIAKRVFEKTITWREMGIQIFVSCVIIGIVYQLGKYSSMTDYEIWNGEITGKNREHGHYLDSYDCFCTTDKDGFQTCQTCYEDRYTVTWDLHSTLGNIRIKALDRSSKSVYNSPDPKAYVDAYKGEPCSASRRYTNYIKLVPESMFNDSEQASLYSEFKRLVPNYPGIYGFYKIRRVFAMGVNVPDLESWNKKLGNILKVLGPKKQANIILIFVNTADPTYKYALESYWLGGKKNDIIVTIGVTDYPNIRWADVITLGKNSGNSMFVVELRDALQNLGSINSPDDVLGIINDKVQNVFSRKPMATYEYLKDEFDPPLWLMMVTIILSIVISVGMTYLFHRHSTFGESTPGRNNKFHSNRNIDYLRYLRRLRDQKRRR